MDRATRFLCLALLPMLSSAAARAGDLPTPGPWTYEMVGGITLTESAFSDNWSGGDGGSVNWVVHGVLDAKRQVSSKFNWSSELQLAYGQTSAQSADPANPNRQKWSAPDKTTDLIMFESVGRFTLGKFVDPYLSFRLDSQFLDESDPLGKLEFNPVKLTETMGIARVLDCRAADTSGCKAEWIARVGVGFRQAFASAFVDTTGDATERFSANDGGLEFQSTAKYPMANDRITYEGILVFFRVLSERRHLTEFDRIARRGSRARAGGRLLEGARRELPKPVHVGAHVVAEREPLPAAGLRQVRRGNERGDRRRGRQRRRARPAHHRGGQRHPQVRTIQADARHRSHAQVLGTAHLPLEPSWRTDHVERIQRVRDAR